MYFTVVTEMFTFELRYDCFANARTSSLKKHNQNLLMNGHSNRTEPESRPCVCLPLRRGMCVFKFVHVTANMSFKF